MKKKFVKSFKPESFGAKLPRFTSRAKRIGGKKSGGSVNTTEEMTKPYKIPKGTTVIDTTEEPKLDELRRLQKKNNPSSQENKMARGGSVKKMFGGGPGGAMPTQAGVRRFGPGDMPSVTSKLRRPLPGTASAPDSARPPLPVRGPANAQSGMLANPSMGAPPSLPPQAAAAALNALGRRPVPPMKKGGSVMKKAKGGGIERRGKTRGKVC